jgi:hypothetical protein
VELIDVCYLLPISTTNTMGKTTGREDEEGGFPSIFLIVYESRCQYCHLLPRGGKMVVSM